MFKLGYKFKLKLNNEQSAQANQFAGNCRFVWNKALNLKIVLWQSEQKSISQFEINKLITSWKKEFEFLKNSPSQTLQQVSKDLDQGFKNFFRRCKSGENPGHPKFKKKHIHDAFRFPQGINLKPSFSRKWGCVTLPKLGSVKFRLSRRLVGEIQNATISKVNGEWYIAFSLKNVPIEPKINASEQIGLDRGVKAFVATSNGELIKGPRPTKAFQFKLAKAQRRLSRKKKFSKNWLKQKRKIQKQHSHIANVRKDFLHKLSTSLVKNHAKIVMEDLKTANMTKSAKGSIEEPGKNVKAKAGLNKAILDQGWYMFETMLTYKLLFRAGELVKVKPHHTSQTCAACGYVNGENRKSQSHFECEQCGHSDNADINAAINILAAGHVVKACGGVTVRDPLKQETFSEKSASAA